MSELVVDDGMVVLRDAKVAAKMQRPRVPNSDNGGAEPCESCGKPVDEVLITTGGPYADAAVWREYPIAVDGWACVACGVFRYPRTMTPALITEIMNEGVTHGRADRFDEAERCFVRVVWDWPGYPPGHLNYAESTRSRLHHTGDSLDDRGRTLLVQRMIEQYEEGVADATQASPAVARAFLTLVEHAIHSRAFDRARRFITALSRLSGIDDDTHRRAAELLAVVEQRLDLFQSAAAVITPFLEPKPPADRKPLAAAILDLEEHLRHAPDRWQSHWLYARALLAADRADDGFAAFARASERFPASVEIARDYSNHLLKAERSADALAVNRAIVVHHPHDAAMLCNLAVTELLCGNIEAATAALEQSRAIAPEDPIGRAVEARLSRGAPFPSTLHELERGG